MDINGFEDYQIYDNGDVFSKKSNRFLKYKKGAVNGYTQCGLMKDGKQHYKYVHRLVAEHYCENTNPEMYTIVDHIDRDKSNNDKDNLRWCDHSINRVNSECYSNTGHKNIYRQELFDKYCYWRVYIRRGDKLFVKTFNCKEKRIQDAIKWRDEKMAELEY